MQFNQTGLIINFFNALSLDFVVNKIAFAMEALVDLEVILSGTKIYRV